MILNLDAGIWMLSSAAFVMSVIAFALSLRKRP